MIVVSHVARAMVVDEDTNRYSRARGKWFRVWVDRCSAIAMVRDSVL